MVSGTAGHLQFALLTVGEHLENKATTLLLKVLMDKWIRYLGSMKNLLTNQKGSLETDAGASHEAAIMQAPAFELGPRPLAELTGPRWDVELLVPGDGTVHASVRARKPPCSLPGLESTAFSPASTLLSHSLQRHRGKSPCVPEAWHFSFETRPHQVDIMLSHGELYQEISISQKRLL